MMAVVGNGGGPYKTLDGNVSTHDADAHKVPINELFHRHTGVATTIAAPVTAGDTSLTVDDGSLFTNEGEFQLEQDLIIESTLPVIKSGGGTNTWGLDRPIENDYDIGATVEGVTTEMAVDGTLASPVPFRIIPDGVQAWHSITITIQMTHGSASDPSRFGDIATGLPNGLILRIFNGSTSKYRIFAVFKNNIQIAGAFGSIDYQPKVGSGDFGTFSTTNIKFRSGAVPRINALNGDFLEALVQDPLSSLLSLSMRYQAHEGEA